MAALTANTLEGLAAGKWVSDKGARGAGTLTAYRSGEGRDSRVLFYFRYTRPDKTRDPYPLGEWNGTGGPLTLKDARARANELSARYMAGARDLRAVLETEEREAQREREAARLADEAALTRQQATLGALMNAYAGELARSGKASAKAVAASIKRNITEPWPTLSKTPADDVTLDDLLAVLAKMADAGKLREAAKVRSYLQAAYNAGIKARQSASASPALRALKITTNPARDLATIEGATNTKERALSVAELRAYWRHIAKMNDARGAALRFHLTTGGQRIQQLARLQLADYDADTQTITIRDSKGRRRAPRLHVVPLIPAAAAAMSAMAPERIGGHLFTISAGKHGVSSQELDKRKNEIVQAMTDAGELPGGPFTLGDIRRTVETRTAAEAVPQEVRAQLQSHGLGGVQARHYDRHDYMDEKRAALETLYRTITGEGATVTPIRKRG